MYIAFTHAEGKDDFLILHLKSEGTSYTSMKGLPYCFMYTWIAEGSNGQNTMLLNGASHAITAKLCVHTGSGQMLFNAVRRSTADYVIWFC
jgi:hypothetical protein